MEGNANINVDNLHFFVKEIFHSGAYLSDQEKSTVNYIIDTWDATGKLTDSDYQKLNDIYITSLRRKGYSIC